MVNEDWLVACDKCHKRWVKVNCPTETVYDELTLGGRLVAQIEINAHEMKLQTIKDGHVWTAEDMAEWGVDARGKYIKPTMMMPRKVIRRDKVTCDECRGSRNKMERVDD